MKKLIILLCILFSGCVGGMTNDEIIKETKKCEKAGLRAATYGNFMGGIIIRCLPVE